MTQPQKNEAALVLDIQLLFSCFPNLVSKILKIGNLNEKMVKACFG